MTASWRVESISYIARTAAGLLVVLLFIVWMGESNKEFPS
jgi:hypothetical protein